MTALRRELQAPAAVCRGQRQRHGFKAATCDLINLDDLHFTNLHLMEYFLNESGTIKPRKHTGLCAKCQVGPLASL
jgi:ribosomal protein S18